jgi:outer membrane lipoprotein-sorting protein
MLRLRLRWWAPLCLLAITFPLGGCLFRTRQSDRHFSNAPLKTATQQELVAYVNGQASKIQSMQATVDINASAGDPKTGRITDYTAIRGYVLARKPDMLRMRGLMPVVRNTAFDMVSDGKEFKLWIPPKNKFVIGPDNETSYQPDKRMENMRPKYIYQALVLREIGPDCPAEPVCEIPVLDNGYEVVLDSKRRRVEQPDYEILVIECQAQACHLARRIEFSRTDLLPHRQRIYDRQGNVATDAHYQDYKDFNGTNFPATIEIERPREDYDITLNILKLDVNIPLSNDQFTLEQPAGAEIVHLSSRRPRWSDTTVASTSAESNQ